MTSRIVALIAALALSSGCSGPTKPSDANTFAWTVDGQPFQSSGNGMTALRSGSAVSIAGSNCGSGAVLGLTIYKNVAVGTHPVSQDGYAMTWTPNAKTANNVTWEVGLMGGSGSLTITSVTDDRIAATFTFQMVPGPGSTGTGTRTVAGAFDLAFADITIC